MLLLYKAFGIKDDFWSINKKSTGTFYCRSYERLSFICSKWEVKNLIRNTRGRKICGSLSFFGRPSEGQICIDGFILVSWIRFLSLRHFGIENHFDRYILKEHWELLLIYLWLEGHDSKAISWKKLFLSLKARCDVGPGIFGPDTL